MTNNRKAFEEAASAKYGAQYVADTTYMPDKNEYVHMWLQRIWEGWQLRESTLPREAIEKAADMFTEYANDAAIDENPEMASKFNNYSRQLRTLLDHPCSESKSS
jgi:hypothetical protein